jgi:hypothetical protein
MLLRAGPLSLRLEPVAFWAKNRAFTLMGAALPDSFRFHDPESPGTIDLPERFGEGAYARLDPGESTLRLDLGGLAVGASTAAQQWGPSEDLPLLLGTNAGGFPHLFLGSAHPLGVGIGQLHGRVVWGSLAQSDYSPMQGHGSRRFMTGAVAVFTPRGLDGLELGVARFFHTAWPDDGLSFSDFLEPFQAIFKSNLPQQDSTPPAGTDDRSSSDNQLASLYARLVLPRSGFEAWAEFAKEDHNWDLQDFFLNPESSSAYTLGARKAWVQRGGLLSLRAELLESQPGNLALVRNQVRFYRHSLQRQGHTLRGQVLGSPAAYGGAGSVLLLERYGERGHWSVDWTRTRLHGAQPPITVLRGGTTTTVQHSLGVQRTLFAGASEWEGGVRGTWELNHNGVAGSDAFNLTLSLSTRAGW